MSSSVLLHLSFVGLNPIRRHPFAFDLYLKKPKTFVGKSPCNQLDDDFQLLTLVNFENISNSLFHLSIKLLCHVLHQGRLSIIKAVYQCKNASDKGVNVSGKTTVLSLKK